MNKPLIIGHRGFPAVKTENTIPSFLEAIKCGCDGIELDVRLTKDWIPVVFHDKNLKRMIGKNVELCKVKFEDLREICHANKNLKKEHFIIPTLEEVVKAIPENIEIRIEIKSSGLIVSRNLMRRIKEILYRNKRDPQNTWITSFSLINMIVAFDKMKEYKRALVCDRKLGSISLMISIGKIFKIDGFDIAWDKFDFEEMKKLNERGFSICLWTLDNPSDISKDVFKMCERIITNNPEIWINYFNERVL